jgi:DNA-binding HxlR family transcriptional regulator
LLALARYSPQRLIKGDYRHIDIFLTFRDGSVRSTSESRTGSSRIVGGRWKAAVLDQLFQGTKRFSELKRGITGITQRTLSQQLRELQSTGIVERTVYPDRPPRVVYAITPIGKSLRPLLDAMCHWGKSHSAAMALRKRRASDRLQ